MLSFLASGLLYGSLPQIIDWQSFIPDSLRVGDNFKLFRTDTLKYGENIYHIGQFLHDKDKCRNVVIVRQVGNQFIQFFNTLTMENGMYKKMINFQAADLDGDKLPELIGAVYINEEGTGSFNALVIWKYLQGRFRQVFKTEDFLLEGALVDFQVDDFNDDGKSEIYIGILNSRRGFLSPYIFSFNDDLDDYLQIWPQKELSLGEFGSVIFNDYDKDGTKELLVSQLVSLGTGDHSPSKKLFFKELQVYRWRDQELYLLSDLTCISRNYEFIFNKLLSREQRVSAVPSSLSHLFLNTSDVEELFKLLPKDAVIADAVWFTKEMPPSEVYCFNDSLITSRYPSYTPFLKLSSGEIGVVFFMHDVSIKDTPLIDDKAYLNSEGYYLYVRVFRRRMQFWEMVWESPQLATGKMFTDMYFYRLNMNGNKIEVTFRSLDGRTRNVSSVYPLPLLKEFN